MTDVECDHPALRAELLGRVAEDQRLARELAPPPGVFRRRLTDEQSWRLREMNADNASWLAGVIERHGWPGRSMVGDDGSHAAWLIAQHADHDVALQRRCLLALRAAADADEASRADVAHLTDRVLVNEGRPQIYGSQFEVPEDRTLRLRPVEDPEHLEERRAAMGLEPMADYVRQQYLAADDDSS